MKIVPGQVAIVTGAAHGVGLNLSRLLLEKGLKVVMIDNDRQALEALEPNLQSEGAVSAYGCDITNEKAVESARDAILKRHPKIDLLFNNAGVSADAKFANHNLQDFRWVMETNLMGTVNMCKYFLPALQEAGRAQIVNVASAAALFGFPGKTSYCASKFALKGFSQALRIELHPERIGVTVAYLGPVQTHMISRSRIDDPARKTQIQEYLDRKGMDPQDVAAEILQAVSKNKPRALISSETRRLAMFDRLMPNLFLRLLTRFQDMLPA